MESIPIHTVVLYPRPHPDNIVALYLVREFGEQHFPGIRQAQVQFWPSVPPGKTAEEYEREGVLLIDMGGGRFDHHHDDHTDDKTTCATTLVARFLNIHERPELKKLLEYVRRDDLEGKGIISKDVIDRAFGLSAIVMNLNRDYPDHPEYVIDVVTRIVAAHYHEEYRRKVLMPREWEALQREGRAEVFRVPTPFRPLTIAMVQSDSKALVGYLRAVGTVQADVVVQRLSTGHTNIVTKQTQTRLNLLKTVAAIRMAEAGKKGMNLSAASDRDLEKPRSLAGLEEWYFDTAANTIQNGGAGASQTPPTRLSLEDVKVILLETLSQSVSEPLDEQRSSPIRKGEGPHVIRFSDLRRRPRGGHHPRGDHDREHPNARAHRNF
jgi:hypothetical protein